MEIFFLILKTAGVILLVILGLILFLAALLLFVPVRYRAEGRLAEETGIGAYIRFSWLLSLITVRIEYADGLETAVRAAGIRLRLKRRRRRAARPDGARPEKEQSGQRGQAEASSGSGYIGRAEASSGSDRIGRAEASSGSGVSGQPEASSGSGRIGQAGASSGSGRIGQAEDSGGGSRGRLAACRERLRSLADGCVRMLQDIRLLQKRLLDNAERIRENAVYYRDLLTEEKSRRTVSMIWLHLKKLLSHTKPKELSVNLTVGAEDPAVTGRVLAVNGMLYPWLGEAVSIRPDFEKACLYGDFYVKGRIRACTALYHILRVILDKRTWTLIRRLKKEELTNG